MWSPCKILKLIVTSSMTSLDYLTEYWIKKDFFLVTDDIFYSTYLEIHLYVYNSLDVVGHKKIVKTKF